MTDFTQLFNHTHQPGILIDADHPSLLGTNSHLIRVFPHKNEEFPLWTDHTKIGIIKNIYMIGEEKEMTKKAVLYRLMLLITIFLLQIFIFPLPKSGIISEALAINGAENRAYAQAEFVPDEIIVKFKEGISEQRRNAILSQHNTTIKSINRRAGFIQLKVHDRVELSATRSLENSNSQFVFCCHYL